LQRWQSQKVSTYLFVLYSLAGVVMTENSEKPKKAKLLEAIFNRRMLICIFNGFTAGLPLYYFFQLVPAWLRDSDASLKTISLVGGLGIFWSFKFIWAPFLDRYALSKLGRRRSWMLLSQFGCLFAMFSYALMEPTTSIWSIVIATGIITFFSSVQDIALDAYRRELLPDNELGLGNSLYMNAYRAAGFIPGGLGLILADYVSWSMTHLIIGAFMLVGIIKTLLIKEITDNILPPKTMAEAIINPFKEFFQRDGFKSALGVLGFIFLYKLGDNMATALQTPFFLDVGFSKAEIGTVVKLTSFWAIIVGGFVGGLVMVKIGINKALWIFGVVQMLTILGFAALSEAGRVMWVLAIAVGGEYLAAGLGSAALGAFMARATSKNFTGTQLALLTSLMALPRTLASVSTGFFIEGVSEKDAFWYNLFGSFEGLGYTNFFILCFFVAIPGMILLKWVAPWNNKEVA
jgi:PAT family beta-lactamase induction signal transducer AmpG